MATSTPPDPPIACTLTPGAAYTERVAWIVALNRDALRSHRHAAGVLTLDYSPDAAARVRELVRREAECCAFLRFDLHATSDAVRLAVAVPAGARDATAALLAPFLAGVLSPDRDTTPGAVDVPAAPGAAAVVRHASSRA